MKSTFGRSLIAAAVVAVLAYIMFNGSEPRTQLAVSAILAIVGGVFTALFFGPTRREE